MKKAVPIFLSSFFLIFSVTGIAATRFISDTAQPKKPHKISQKKFVQQFIDYKNAGIITHFFFKRRNRSGWTPLLISLPFTLAAACVLVFATIGTTSIASLLVIFFLALIVTGGLILSVIGLIFLLLFSRKRLWQTLIRYTSTGELPKKLKKKLRL